MFTFTSKSLLFLNIILIMGFGTLMIQYNAQSTTNIKNQIITSIDSPPAIRKDPRNVQQQQSTSPSIQLINTTCNSPIRGHFDEIYKNKGWGTELRNISAFYGEAHWPFPPQNSRERSASGLGSWLGKATEHSLKIIKETIVEYGVTSMIDVPWYVDDFAFTYYSVSIFKSVPNQLSTFVPYLR